RKGTTTHNLSFILFVRKFTTRRVPGHSSGSNRTCLICREAGQVRPSTHMDGFGVYRQPTSCLGTAVECQPILSRFLRGQFMLGTLPTPILLDIAILCTALCWGLGFFLADRKVYLFASLAIGCFVCLFGYSVEAVG